MPPYNQGTDRQAQRVSHILQKLLPEYAVYALEILERAGFERHKTMSGIMVFGLKPKTGFEL